MAVPVAPPAQSSRPTRRVSILGIIAFSLAVLALLPTVVVFIVASFPGMADYGWLLLVTLPWAAFMDILAVIGGVIALILDIRARRKPWWSIAALVLSVPVLIGTTLILNG